MFQTNPHKQTKVVVIANQKGGVGKTTNTLHLAAGLTELGRDSLIIDLDATAGATKKLGAPLVGWNTTYELVTGEVEPTEAVITEEDEEVKLPRGVHLVPSGPMLDRIDAYLLSPDNLGVIAQDLLLSPLSTLRGFYDYIILDTPPQVTKFTFPAYKAADYIILTTQLEKLSFEALADANKLIASVNKHGNPDAQLLGIIVSMFPKPITRIASHYLNRIDEKYRNDDSMLLRFENTIQRNVAIQEAAAVSQTLFDYEPSHKACEQYRGLVREVEARIEQICRQELVKREEVANG